MWAGLARISERTVPNLEELKLFASLNGLALAGPRIASKRAVSAGSTKAKQRTPMPPIFEPGTWPRAKLANDRTDVQAVITMGKALLRDACTSEQVGPVL